MSLKLVPICLQRDLQPAGQSRDQSETFVGITMRAQHRHVYQPSAMVESIVYKPNPTGNQATMATTPIVWTQN